MRKKSEFSNRIVVLGFGSIGRAVLPLIFDNLDVSPDRVGVFASSIPPTTLLSDLGVSAKQGELTQENYRTVLDG